MEKCPTFIFMKEKQKNEHGEVPHVHFHERKKKMNMEKCPMYIFTKEKPKNEHGEVPHVHFY